MTHEERQQRLAEIRKKQKQPPGYSRGLRYLKISEEVSPVGWNPVDEVNNFIDYTREQQKTIGWLFAEVERLEKDLAFKQQRIENLEIWREHQL